MTPRTRLTSPFPSSLLVGAALGFGGVAPAPAAIPYQQPPEPIRSMLDAPSSPAMRISPDGTLLVELELPGLPSIDEIAEPYLALAGRRINPVTNGPAREQGFLSVTVKSLAPGPGRRLALPKGVPVRSASFSADSKRLALTLKAQSGIELWVADMPNGEPRLLVGPRLNAAFGAPCSWLHADEGLTCLVVPEGRGPAPVASSVPTGPVVEECLGRKSANRTYTNLLQSPHDEALFEHWFSSELVHVALDGSLTRLAGPALIASAEPSPDGRFVALETVHRPFSTQVPFNRFPLRKQVIDRSGQVVRLVADLPLADDVPITFSSTRQGPRGVQWRADRPATLAWFSALDGGDARADAEQRDELVELDAPFSGEPRVLWRSELRAAGVEWGNDSVALVSEWWHDTRRTRTFVLDPSQPGTPARLLIDRSYEDAYSDPGEPLTRPGPFGEAVLRLGAGGTSILLAGDGASPDGVQPFLDRVDLRTGKATRLWQSQGAVHEQVLLALDDEGKRFVTRRQSQADPPNVMLRTRGSARVAAVTTNVDPMPQLAGLAREVLRYSRADGVELSATLYLPPGHDPAKNGPLPMLFWVYPAEFKDKAAAGRVTRSEHVFSRPSGSSVLFLLTQGWAILDNPTLPIVGEGDIEPNDSYVEQLVAGARAAVDAVVARGIADPERLAIGGHSYGAFTTANLLAHCDLFRAGVARSGAYNRSLTPFGFQGEQRDFWEAQDTYIAMSPFTVAAQIKEPLLLIHGAEDSNSGTFPIQSERLYEAMKGLGGTVRWVVLPSEDHGYRARESVGHVLWETTRWLDEHVKSAAPRTAAAPPAPSQGL